MLLVLSLLLLTGLSMGIEAGDKELTLDAKAGSWVTVTLEVGTLGEMQGVTHGGGRRAPLRLPGEQVVPCKAGCLCLFSG